MSQSARDKVAAKFDDATKKTVVTILDPTLTSHDLRITLKAPGVIEDVILDPRDPEVRERELWGSS